jgi:hypothetical protein
MFSLFNRTVIDENEQLRKKIEALETERDAFKSGQEKAETVMSAMAAPMFTVDR